MSIKTLRKRIALVAVSALGVGLLSVAPAFAGAPAAGDFLISSTSDGSTNYGIISTTGTTNQVVEMYTTGQANITTVVADIDAGDDNDSLRLKITQGSALFTYATKGSTNVTAFDAAAVNANNQTVTWQSSNDTNDSGDAGQFDAYLRPTAAGKIVVQYVVVDDSAGTETLQSTITIFAVTSAAQSVSGVVSVADSYFYRSATCVTGAATNIDADTSNEANGGVAYLSFALYDALGGVNTTAGSLVATSSSSDAVVAIDGAPTATSTKTAVSAELADGTSNDGACVGIAQAVTNKPVTTTVTVSFNGEVIGSRTVTIVGQLAKLAISVNAAEGLAVAPRNSSSGTHFYALGYDSAGNRVATSSTPTVDSAGLNTIVTNVTVSGALGASDSPGKSGYFSCNATKSGSANVRIKHADAAGATIYSNTVTARCGGTTAYKVTASLDKATYVPGDVATLTITATDSGGLPVADTTTLGSGAAIAGSNMTAVTAPSSADTFTGGTKTYKFVVGSTEGAYQMAISTPAYAAYGVTDQTVAYSIKSTSTAVTNAEVLSAIVKLIASINKQIRALQKSLRR